MLSCSSFFASILGSIRHLQFLPTTSAVFGKEKWATEENPRALRGGWFVEQSLVFCLDDNNYLTNSAASERKRDFPFYKKWDQFCSLLFTTRAVKISTRNQLRPHCKTAWLVNDDGTWLLHALPSPAHASTQALLQMLQSRLWRREVNRELRDELGAERWISKWDFTWKWGVVEAAGGWGQSGQFYNVSPLK